MRFHFPLPKKRRWRITIYTVCTLLVLAAVDQVWVRAWRVVHPGPRTTVFLGPPAADRPVNFIKATHELFSRGITPDENAAIPLIEAVGPPAQPSPDSAHFAPYDLHTFYQWLGAPELEGRPPIMVPVVREPGHPTPVEKALADATTHLLTAQEYPEVAAWVHANEAAIDLLHVASRRPRYYMPLVYRDIERGWTISGLLPALSATRDLARADAFRAMLRAAQGGIPGATDDLMALHWFARRMAQGSTFINWLVARQIDVMASDGDAALATGGQLTAEQARVYLTALAALPSFPGPAHAVAGERYWVLDAITATAARGPAAVLKSLLPRDDLPAALRVSNAIVPVHFDALLRQTNDLYDRLDAAFALPTLVAQRAAIKQVGHDLDQLRTTGWMYYAPGRMLLLTLFPHFDALPVLAFRGAAQSALARVALALAAYHAEAGAYPDALSALIPRDLPAMPDDPFTGQPLHYRRTADGYLLYSVNDDGVDNGGASMDDARQDAALRERLHGQSDLVVRVGAPPTTAPATAP